MDSNQLMEKVAEVAPEKYDFIMKTAAEVKESPFRDEILEGLDGILKRASDGYAKIKHAFPMPTGGRPGLGTLAGNVGLAGLGTLAGGIGLALAGDATDWIRRGLTKSRDYKRMLASNPDLKEKPANQVQAIFSTLHRFNPDFASDPVVSGSFVRNHVDLAGEGAGAVGLDSMKNLVDARKNLHESKRFPQMAKIPGLGGGKD